MHLDYDTYGVVYWCRFLVSIFVVPFWFRFSVSRLATSQLRLLYDTCSVVFRCRFLVSLFGFVFRCRLSRLFIFASTMTITVSFFGVAFHDFSVASSLRHLGCRFSVTLFVSLFVSRFTMSHSHLNYDSCGVVFWCRFFGVAFDDFSVAPPL